MVLFVACASDARVVPGMRVGQVQRQIHTMSRRRRRRKAATKRRVEMRTEIDGMGRLAALLPADRMVMVFR
ncbi:hypothetical protein FAGKG844_300019 [Frankia sp. AgKG'84/4]